MSNSTKTLRQYLSLIPIGGMFRIPDFQRGYIWGKPRTDGKPNSVEYLLGTLLEGYENDTDIFLQGITYTRPAKDVAEIIDGQQRTTFLYLLLKYLKYEGPFIISYTIRRESNKFLEDYKGQESIVEDPDCKFQDIFFFNRTIRIIHERLSAINNFSIDAFRDYLLDHVRMLCIEISPDKAEVIFTMMNGNKAVMKQEELIKAEILRRASLPSEEIKEIESRDIRGRMAREWDEWLHWWNRPDVAEFYMSGEHPLGWLIPLYLGNAKVSFEVFRKKIEKDSSNKIKEAKELFRTLRLLQRQLQDAFSNPISYNYIGAILRSKTSEAERFTFLRWFFNQKDETLISDKMNSLRRYFDLSIIRCNHEDIVMSGRDWQKKVDECIADFYDKLNSDDVYRESYEDGARWLLRCNIIEDCRQEDNKGRKFNFKIWNNRSLEHIYPKSKFGHRDAKNTDTILDYKDEPIPDDKGIEIMRGNPEDADYVNEHSIGNLVLIYGKDNSSFGTKTFEGKKDSFFKTGEDYRYFESRHLIHTISVFASSQWGRNEIIARCAKEVNDFDKTYSVYKSLLTDSIANE